MTEYKPEGAIAVRQGMLTRQALESALITGKILEGKAILCDKDKNLIVALGAIKGVIRREEAAFLPGGGALRDIAVITRVGKQVAFKVVGFETDASGVQTAVLSRRAAQEECYKVYLSNLRPGDVIAARVTHMEQFGCFVDVGCGVVSMVAIDQISTSRISHPRDRFQVGQNIFAVVKETGEDGRLILGHKELLGTWTENVSSYAVGQTAAGIIRGIEPYGIFVELTPNLAGLAEYRDDVAEGETASVYIKNIIPEKMKVKLLIIEAFREPIPHICESDYYITGGHITDWRYTPPGCEKTIESSF